MWPLLSRPKPQPEILRVSAEPTTEPCLLLLARSELWRHPKNSQQRGRWRLVSGPAEGLSFLGKRLPYGPYLGR
jgi:hypothetical protein